MIIQPLDNRIFFVQNNISCRGNGLALNKWQASRQLMMTKFCNAIQHHWAKMSGKKPLSNLLSHCWVTFSKITTKQVLELMQMHPKERFHHRPHHSCIIKLYSIGKLWWPLFVLGDIRGIITPSLAMYGDTLDHIYEHNEVTSTYKLKQMAALFQTITYLPCYLLTPTIIIKWKLLLLMGHSGSLYYGPVYIMLESCVFANQS